MIENSDSQSLASGSLGVGQSMDEISDRGPSLAAHVTEAIERYLGNLNGEQPCGVYAMVLIEVEKPLLSAVMKYCENNQSKASKALGINRNTLRKKLETHGLIRCPSAVFECI